MKYGIFRREIFGGKIEVHVLKEYMCTRVQSLIISSVLLCYLYIYIYYVAYSRTRVQLDLVLSYSTENVIP